MALYQGYTGGNINIDVSGGNGVEKSGFTMEGDIEMDGNEVKGLGAPTDDTSAVTKKWVDNEIVKQASVTIQPAGFTMTGDINMGNNKVIGLKSDGSDFSEASSVQYVHTYAWNNYLAANGFNKMKGVLNAGGFEVQGLPTTASRSDSAVSKFRMEEWTRGQFLPLDGSKSMTDNLSMDSKEIVTLGDPTTGKSAVNKDWVVGMLNKPVTRLNVAGDIDMKNHEIKNVGDPTDDKSAVSKKWITDNNTDYLKKNNTGLTQAVKGYVLFAEYPRVYPGGIRTSESVVIRSDLADYLYTDVDGDLDMKENEIKNVGDPTDDKSVVNKKWVTSGFTLNGDLTIANGNSIYIINQHGAKIAVPNIQTVINQISRFALKLDGSNEMTGNLQMGGNEIQNIGAPASDTSAVSKKWVNDKISGGRSRRETYSGLTLSDDLDMNNNEIIKLGSPTTDNSAVSKKWVTDHVSGSSINTSGFTMTGNIDMGGFSITGLKSGSEGDTAALSSKTLDTWGLQFLKRNGGVLASNLDVNNYELTKVGNPTTDKSAVNRKWVNDNFMSSSGLVQGDLDMGDSSRIIDLSDPVNDQDAVNKRWVVAGFEPKFASGKYVETKHHIYTDWVWGYRNIHVATTYYPYCHDQIPPMWRTETINSLANINLQTITLKHTANTISDATNVNIELLLRAVYYVLGSNGKYTQTKKDFVLGTLDLSKTPHCYFLGTRQSDGASGACWAFKVNIEYYLGNISELVNNTLAWCVVIKAEQAMPTGKSMDLAFQWQLIYAGSRGG